MSKESKTMLMPSMLKGADKYNPCLGSGCCDKGWCKPRDKWAYLVQHYCISNTEPVPGKIIETKPPHNGIHVLDNKTGITYTSIVKAAKVLKISAPTFRKQIESDPKLRERFEILVKERKR